MQFRTWVFVCLSVFSSGCAVVSSSDVNPSTIYSQYSATYDESTNGLEFNASFFVGNELGTYVELDDKSSVTINSMSMSEDKTIFKQVIYERSLLASAQSLSDAYTFSYTDDAGHVYHNVVQIPGRVSVSSLPSGSVSIASGFSVGWQSQTYIGSRETLLASLNGVNGTASSFSGWGGTSGQIVFQARDLQRIAPGPATLTLCRSNYTSNIQGSSAGGSLSTRYCGAPVAITLTQ